MDSQESLPEQNNLKQCYTFSWSHWYIPAEKFEILLCLLFDIQALVMYEGGRPYVEFNMGKKLH